MLGCLIACVMNSASRNDGYVTILSNVEVVINKLLNSRLGQDNGNVKAFVSCVILDIYINSGLVFFFLYNNVFR